MCRSYTTGSGRRGPGWASDGIRPNPAPPLFHFRVAEAIREMMRELDDPSGTKTAKRLGVSTPLISDFAGIMRTPPQYRGMHGRGSPVPRSAFRRAGLLPSDGTITREDFDLPASGVAADRIRLVRGGDPVP